jgi:WD40 repeat protein
VAFDDRGRLISASEDGSVRVWDVASGRCIWVFMAAGDDWLALHEPTGRFRSSRPDLPWLAFLNGDVPYPMSEFPERALPADFQD